MTQEESHEAMVAELFKDPAAILATLTPEKVDLLHAAVGLVGEAAELLELVKKHVFNNQPLDTGKVVLEGGDVEFYIAALRKVTGIGRDIFLNANETKLRKRYPKGYSDIASLKRVDTNQPSIWDNLGT